MVEGERQNCSQLAQMADINVWAVRCTDDVARVATNLGIGGKPDLAPLSGGSCDVEGSSLQ